jgi:hypothetical protein
MADSPLRAVVPAWSVAVWMCNSVFPPSSTSCTDAPSVPKKLVSVMLFVCCRGCPSPMAASRYFRYFQKKPTDPKSSAGNAAILENVEASIGRGWRVWARSWPGVPGWIAPTRPDSSSSLGRILCCQPHATSQCARSNSSVPKLLI